MGHGRGGNGTSSSESGRTVRRRRFLRATGTGLVAGGLAGCAGGGDGGDGGGSDGGGSGGYGGGSSGGGTPSTKSGSSSSGLSGVTFEYWNQLNVQSRAAKETSKSQIETFEQDTGTTIKVSWSGYGDVIGAKWKTSFSNDNYPVVYDSTPRWDGQFIAGDWILPFEEYMDEFDEETLNAIEWIFPRLETQYAGFEKDIYEIPIGFNAGVPFVVRMDHMDAAGIDRGRWPPKDYDDLIDIATTAQENGPAEYGLQIHGTKFDSGDCLLPTMTINEGGLDGLFVNEDWSDTNWDNDIFKEQTRKWVEIYTEHGLSNPATPNHDDEGVTQELVGQGLYSISTADFLNHPAYLETNPDPYQAGDIQWQPQWDGAAEYTGRTSGYCMGITKKPDGADAAKWEKQQQAGIEFIKLWLSKDFQRQIFDTFGFMPIREDVWDEFDETKFNLFNTFKTMAETGKGPAPWSSHPQSVGLQYNVPGPELQKALQGEQSPEEACDRIGQQIRDQIL